MFNLTGLNIRSVQESLLQAFITKPVMLRRALAFGTGNFLNLEMKVGTERARSVIRTGWRRS